MISVCVYVFAVVFGLSWFAMLVLSRVVVWSVRAYVCLCGSLSWLVFVVLVCFGCVFGLCFTLSLALVWIGLSCWFLFVVCVCHVLFIMLSFGLFCLVIFMVVLFCFVWPLYA